MSQILPNLFLGSLKVASDAKFIKDNKIKHILSCGKFNIPILPKSVLRRQEFKLKDNNIEPIKFYFWEAFEFISKAITTGENVLVHCLKGMSRSASIVMSYVMIISFKFELPNHLAPDITAKMTVAQVQKYVQERHPNAYPNKHFMQNLHSLYIDLRGPLKTQTMPQQIALLIEEPFKEEPIKPDYQLTQLLTTQEQTTVEEEDQEQEEIKMPSGTLNAHKQVFEYGEFEDDESEDEIFTHEKIRSQSKDKDTKKKEAIVYYYDPRQQQQDGMQQQQKYK